MSAKASPHRRRAAWGSLKTNPNPADSPGTSLLGGELNFPPRISAFRICRRAGLMAMGELSEFKLIRGILRLQGLPCFPFMRFD
jgi:hypothetical protein